GGDAGHGLLWLARALELAPDDADDLERVIRANLGAWRGRVNVLSAVLPQENGVSFVIFSPDGKRILSAGPEETRLWDAADGRLISRLLTPDDEVLAAHFSADGSTILTRSRDKIQKWPAATGQALGSLEATYEVSSAVFV